MATTLVKIGVFCTCGMPLEQVHSQKATMNFMTFKPCQCCSAPAKVQRAVELTEEERRYAHERST